MATEKQRQNYIEKYCDFIPTTGLGDDNDDYLNIVNKESGAYLTLATKHKVIAIPDSLDFLIERGIIEGIDSTFGKGRPANFGFSPKENKWFGWSRGGAIDGFTIGSTVKKGDIAFRASNKDEFEEATIRFWTSDTDETGVRIQNRTKKGFDVVITMLYDSTEHPGEKVKGQEYIWPYEYPEEYGRGEWTAETMEDAKRMAMDFAEAAFFLFDDINSFEL